MLMTAQPQSRFPAATRIARIVGLAVLLTHPALAQLGPPLKPLDLNGSIKVFPAPTPVDANGNPIQPPPPTDAEREIARREAAARAAQFQAEENRQALEKQRSLDQERATARLAEEQQFHDRIMTSIYVGLAILVVAIGAFLLNRGSSKPVSAR